MYKYKITFVGGIEKEFSVSSNLVDTLRQMKIGQALIWSDELTINVDNILFIDRLSPAGEEN